MFPVPCRNHDSVCLKMCLCTSAVFTLYKLGIVPLWAHDVTVCCVCSVCMWVYTPLLKHLSHSPSYPEWDSRWAEAWLKRCLCCFSNQPAASEGLSVTTTFPVSSNSTTAAVAPALLFIRMIWKNIVWCPLIMHWLYFSWSFLYNFTCTSCVLFSFWPDWSTRKML